MPKKIYKKTAEGNYSNKTYSPLGVIPTETEWNKVVRTDTAQTITGVKTFSNPIKRTSIKNAQVLATDSNGEVTAKTLSKSDVGLGNVDNTADSNKSVKHATSAVTATDATNAINLVSSDKKTKYTVDTITDLQIAVKRKMESEYHDFSYGIFFRDLDGKQYHGIESNNRRMIVAFDNTTNPTNSSDDIGYKMVDLCTVMSSGINDNDEKDYGGAIFANAISPNQSTGDNADLLLSASQEAAAKFKEAHGSAVNGGFGCLDGTARGSLFKSRINGDSGKIYTSALMFRRNLESNDADLMASQSTANSLMPCFSIYNGIQVTTSGTIYNKNDTIDVLKDRNEQNAAFLAYSKTGKNVDIDRITGNYQPKGSYVTTNTEQTISAKKTFSTTPVLSAIKNKKVIGTDANGLVEAHTLGISDITNLQSTLNGKANSSHTHTISQITNLQTTLNNKQDKIEYPCRFDGSGSNYVKLLRDGTNNYSAHIQHGSATYNSSSQYPSISVSFPYAFGGRPTVVVTFAPSSNSTSAEEALKVTNITATGFSVITRMSASVSSGYFRINWIAIYTV